MAFKVGDSLVINYYNRPDDIDIFIIGKNKKNEDEFLCYVLNDVNISDSFKITCKHLEEFNVHKKYLGTMGVKIYSFTYVKKHIKAPPGCTCTKCNEYVLDAEEIENFICYGCKQSPYRFSY